MIEFLERRLPILAEPWYWPVAGSLAVVLFVAAIVIKYRATRWKRSPSQDSTDGIRRLRDGQ